MLPCTLRGRRNDLVEDLAIDILKKKQMAIGNRPTCGENAVYTLETIRSKKNSILKEVMNNPKASYVSDEANY